MTSTEEKKQYFLYRSRRVGPGGVFKSFVPWVAGRIYDVQNYDDIQLIQFEPYTDHKSSLDYLKGV